MNKKTQELISFFLTIAIIVFVFINSLIFFTRLDLTENKAFTISDVSRGLHEIIDEQVNITYYVSDQLKLKRSEPGQIEDLLYEYAAHSRGKITVQVVDPIEEGIEQQVKGLGISSVPYQTVEKTQQSVAQVYTGIAIEYIDRVAAIPLAFDTTQLEYDLTSTIRKLVKNENQAVGILIGNAMYNLSQGYGTLGKYFNQKYTLQQLQPGEDIPDNIKVLLVLGNKDLQEFDLYPIDQYIMKGGKVLFAVDSIDIDLARNFDAAKTPNQDIFNMLYQYGVNVGDELVLDISAQVIQVPVSETSFEYMRYPHMVELLGDFVSKNNPITSRFSGLVLAWTNRLTFNNPDGVEAEAILKSTPRSWLMKDPYIANPAAVSEFTRTLEGTQDQYVLGYALNGTFPSYFEGRTPPAREGASRDWSQDTTIAKGADTRMVIIGDADFPGDIMMQLAGANQIYFLDNVIEWLSNDDDLLEIRTRTQKNTQLNKILDEDKKAEAASTAFGINVIFVPLLVVLFGVYRFIARNRKQKQGQPEKKEVEEEA